MQKLYATWTFSRWRDIIPLVLWNYFLSAPTWLYVKILHNVENSPLECKFGSAQKLYATQKLCRWGEIISLLACKSGSTQKLYRNIEIVPLAQNSPAGASCQWNIESWSNWRIDSNRKIDLTIKIDSTIRIGSTLRIDSTFRIDSTDILIWSSYLNILMIILRWSCQRIFSVGRVNGILKVGRNG